MNRYIFFGTFFQQRLGFLIGLTLLCSPLRGKDTRRLAREFYSSIFRKQRFWIRPKKEEREVEEMRELKEVDWDIPGHRRITEPVIVENDLVTWARSLKLIRGENNILTSMGYVLTKLAEKSQVKVFLEDHILPNPLRLTMRQKIFFLYLLLKTDACLILPLIRQLSSHDTFDAHDAADILRKVTMGLATNLQASDSYERISKGKKLEKNLSLLEDFSLYARAVSKLEPLTDLGIFKRKVKRRYIYENTPIARRFYAFPELSDILDNSMFETFMRARFFEAASKSYGIKPKKPGEKTLHRIIAQTYTYLAGGLGLAKIKELWLLAGLSSLVADDPLIIEEEEVTKALLELDKEFGKNLSLHVDSYGSISYLKIRKEALDTLLKEGTENPLT